MIEWVYFGTQQGRRTEWTWEKDSLWVSYQILQMINIKMLLRLQETNIFQTELQIILMSQEFASETKILSSVPLPQIFLLSCMPSALTHTDIL